MKRSRNTTKCSSETDSSMQDEYEFDIDVMGIDVTEPRTSSESYERCYVWHSNTEEADTAITSLEKILNGGVYVDD